MKKQNMLIRISLCLTILLLVAAVFVGCGEKIDKNAVSETEYTFTFTAVFADGSKETHEITTNYEVVGKALVEEGLIAGDDSETGIYVKTVCGVTADYNVDQNWWALYIDGEMSMVGVDYVKCADVDLVEFRVEK